MLVVRPRAIFHGFSLVLLRLAKFCLISQGYLTKVETKNLGWSTKFGMSNVSYGTKEIVCFELFGFLLVF